MSHWAQFCLLLWLLLQTAMLMVIVHPIAHILLGEDIGSGVAFGIVFFFSMRRAAGYERLADPDADGPPQLRKGKLDLDRFDGTKK